MLVAVAILLGGLLFCAIIIRPSWGVLLLWPVLLFYPHALLQELLPFNIGFDDIYVAFVFIVTLAWRLPKGQFRFGKWGMFVLGYWLLLVVSSFYGLMYENMEFAVGLAVKSAVKRSTIPMVAFIALNSVDELDQVPRLIQWFFIGAIGLSILAIVQYFHPELVAPFYQLEKMTPGAEVWRATGTTRGPWEIGGVLGVSLIMCLAFLILGRGFVSRSITLVCAILGLIAIVLSLSRSGWLFVATGGFTVLVFSKKPLTAIVVAAIIGSAVLAFPFLVEMMTQRIEQTGTIGGWRESANMRLIIWKEILSDISVGSVIVGIGRIAATVRYGYTAHNYYVAVLVERGIVGICYFVLLGISLWRRTWYNIRVERSAAVKAVWKGIFAVNVGVLFYSLPVETLDVDLVAKTLFFLWSLFYLRDYVPESDRDDGLCHDICYSGVDYQQRQEVYQYGSDA